MFRPFRSPFFLFLLLGNIFLQLDSAESLFNSLFKSKAQATTIAAENQLICGSDDFWTNTSDKTTTFVFSKTPVSASSTFSQTPSSAIATTVFKIEFSSQTFKFTSFEEQKQTRFLRSHSGLSPPSHG